MGPSFILEQASRSAHYTQKDYETLAFAGQQPAIGELSLTWRTMLKEAEEIIALLPEEQLGQCVITGKGELFNGSLRAPGEKLAAGEIHFHAGSIRRAGPKIKTQS
ncbi:MAG: hypothetical protein A2Z99_08670 [Treponema sp. GWB1_62_6]|nr:MAG: hypothetical protein A2Y36_10525 [Treponema sp. GWA1_62_8]OHE65901.1 MAG: hypothetical protein A2Z99_08670 [Treponema sp. GWB1_62_6]OHE67587.1 MAG: hypothetical protein A2001_15700 [Treponema sp. GWC1_61_84]OHE76629.1 MAG: hypothetical protein A2413_18660 [Treponema sp. RIFOXYC1_FULL_61_9]HCM25743.1 hypothetical protein [Treponema sp.]